MLFQQQFGLADFIFGLATEAPETTAPCCGVGFPADRRITAQFTNKPASLCRIWSSPVRSRHHGPVAAGKSPPRNASVPGNGHRRPRRWSNRWRGRAELEWYRAKYKDDEIRWGPIEEHDPPFNFTALPLTDERRVLGVLRLSDTHLHFQERDRSLEVHGLDVLAALAGALASAMVAAERRVKWLFMQRSELLFGLDSSVEEIVTATLEDVVASTPASDALVVLQDSRDAERYILCRRDLPDTSIGADAVRASRSVVATVLQSGRQVSSMETPSLVGRPVLRDDPATDARSLIAMPLISRRSKANRGVVGALVATSAIPDAFSTEDVAIVSLASARIMDKVQLLIAEVTEGELRARIDRWERAAMAGLYASSEAHTIRKFVSTVIPHIESVLGSDVVKRDSDLEEHAKLARPQLKNLQQQVDRLQHRFRSRRVAHEQQDLRQIVRNACDEMNSYFRVRHTRLTTDLPDSAVFWQGRCAGYSRCHRKLCV